jgi:integrase
MGIEALEDRRKATDRPKAYAVILETAVREANAGELTLARSEELLRRLRAVANPDFREVSLDEWFGNWIDTQRPHIGDSTAASYEDARRRLNAAWGESKSKGPLIELTNTDLRQAITQVAKKVRAVTANMDLAVLRRVLEAATVERLVTANVAKSIRALPTTDSTERAPFTAAEVRRLIDSAPTDEWRGLVLLAAHTGLRLSDVLALHRNNIEGTDIIIRPKKTARSKRTVRVPMTPMTWCAGFTKKPNVAASR